MVTQVIDMKKKSTTDGRRSRYEPISAAELRSAATELETLSGHFRSAALEIVELKLAGVQIDGRNMLVDAIKEMKQVSKRIKTALYEVRLDLE